MSRFNFGPLDAEPSGLADMYRVLSDAQDNAHSSAYIIPAELQTHAYARSVLKAWNTPDLVDVRADTRVNREHIISEAGVSNTVYLGEAALRHLYVADKAIMLEQLARIQAAVEADVEAGPASRTKVGIVPVSYIKPLPSELPNGLSLATAQDVRMVETESGVFVMDSDQFVVDRIGDPGLRSADALRRLAILERWSDMAMFGEAALSLVEDSRVALLAA